MASQYSSLRQKHQEEVEAFPIAFAFSNSQLKEALVKLGLKESQTNKVYSIGGGGIIRKTDSEAWGELLVRHEKEMKEAIRADETGEGFIYEMFYYELANHEYGYTGELDDTLNAVGLTMEKVNADERLLRGLEKARKKIIKNSVDF